MNWGSWLREGNIYKRALNGVDFGKFKDGGGKYSYYYWSGLVSGQRRWLLRRKRVSSRGARGSCRLGRGGGEASCACASSLVGVADRVGSNQIFRISDQMHSSTVASCN